MVHEIYTEVGGYSLMLANSQLIYHYWLAASTILD